jgi:hypothetical protein
MLIDLWGGPGWVIGVADACLGAAVGFAAWLMGWLVMKDVI